MNASSQSSTLDQAASRARAYTLSSRRRRLVWRLLLFTLITAAMIYVAVLNRDTIGLREERKLGQRIAEALERQSAERGSPPLTFPSDPSLQAARDRFYFNIFYAGAARINKPAGVCCLKEPLQFFVRDAGRMVILYDGADYSAQWFTEDEFRARAKDLGFNYLLAN